MKCLACAVKLPDHGGFRLDASSGPMWTEVVRLCGWCYRNARLLVSPMHGVVGAVTRAAGVEL